MTTEPAEAYKLLVTFPPELGVRLKAAAASSGRSRTRLVLDACQAADWGREPAERCPQHPREPLRQGACQVCDGGLF
jgi:hypothetical protein